MKISYWAVVAENSINVISWTILAMYFGKWWIALFALLNITYPRKNGKETKEAVEKE